MALYIEEEVWKCPKHPSKRRRNGVCPVCLKDRLVILCPDCANVRPCSCPAAVAATSDGRRSLLRRSRSVGINFLRFGYARSVSGRAIQTETGKRKTASFWSVVLPSSSKSTREPKDMESGYGDEKIAEFTRLMMRTRSGSGNRDPGGRWHFPGQMKISRHSKPAKVVQERYPSCNTLLK